MSATAKANASDRRRQIPVHAVCTIVDRPPDYDQRTGQLAADRELAQLLLDRFFTPTAPAVARLYIRPDAARRPAKGYYPARRGDAAQAPSLGAVLAHVSDATRRPSADRQVHYTAELGAYATSPPATIHLAREDNRFRAPDLANPVVGLSMFLAWDIDGQTFTEAAATARRILAVLEVHGAHGLLERSRGGSGAHAWLLLDAPAPSDLCRAVARAVAREAQVPLRHACKSGAEVDVAYPAQATVSSDAPLGSLIALPLAAEPRSRNCSIFIDPVTLEPLADQLAVLRDAPRASASWLADLAHEWKLDLSVTDLDDDGSAAANALNDEQRASIRAARRQGPRDASDRSTLTPGVLDETDAAWVDGHPATAKLLAPLREPLANRHSRDFHLACLVLRASGGDTGLAARLLLAAPDSKAAATDGDGGPRYLERTIARAAAIVASEPKVTIMADGSAWIGAPNGPAMPTPSWGPDDDRTSAANDDDKPAPAPRQRPDQPGSLRNHTAAETAHIRALGLAVQADHHAASRRLRRAGGCNLVTVAASCPSCDAIERIGNLACEDPLCPYCTRARWALRRDVLLATWTEPAGVVKFPVDITNPALARRQLLARVRNRADPDRKRLPRVPMPEAYRWEQGFACAILLAPADEIDALKAVAAAEGATAEVLTASQVVAIVGNTWLAPARARRELVAAATAAADRGEVERARIFDERIVNFPFNSPHIVRTRANAAGEAAFPWPSDASIRATAIAAARERRGEPPLQPGKAGRSECCNALLDYTYASATTGRLLARNSKRPLAKKHVFDLLDIHEPPPTLDPRLVPTPTPAAQEGGPAPT